jgi:hypothetical protein
MFRRTLLVSLVGAVALAVPAVAAGPLYRQGRYSGRVKPTSVDRHYRGTITFLVKGRVIVKLKTKLKLGCAHQHPDAIFRWSAPKSWKVRISRNGKFDFNDQVPPFLTHVWFRGKLKGRTATGWIYEDETQDGYCSMDSARFTAKH